MIDPRLSWFVMGATFSAVLFGWPWHPRFSRFSRRRPYSSAAIAFCKPSPPSGPPPLKLPRGTRSITFFDPEPGRQPTNPFTGGPARLELHEGRVQRGNNSGGPTTPKPDIIPKPQPPPGRVVDASGRLIGYIPRSQGGTPNPPPSNP